MTGADGFFSRVPFRGGLKCGGGDLVGAHASKGGLIREGSILG